MTPEEISFANWMWVIVLLYALFEIIRYCYNVYRCCKKEKRKKNKA